MWSQSETPILKRARITRENLVALSKPFARSGGSLGGNEGNWTTRKAVNSGSSLQTNSGPSLAQCNRIAEGSRAEYVEPDVLKSTRGLHPNRGPGMDRIGRRRFRRPRMSVNIESPRTDVELPSEDAIRGEIAWARPKFQNDHPSPAWTILNEKSSKGTRGVCLFFVPGEFLSRLPRFPWRIRTGLGIDRDEGIQHKPEPSVTQEQNRGCVQDEIRDQETRDGGKEHRADRDVDGGHDRRTCQRDGRRGVRPIGPRRDRDDLVRDRFARLRRTFERREVVSCVQQRDAFCGGQLRGVDLSRRDLRPLDVHEYALQVLRDPFEQRGLERVLQLLHESHPIREIALPARGRFRDEAPNLRDVEARLLRGDEER